MTTTDCVLGVTSRVRRQAPLFGPRRSRRPCADPQEHWGARNDRHSNRAVSTSWSRRAELTLPHPSAASARVRAGAVALRASRGSADRCRPDRAVLPRSRGLAQGRRAGRLELDAAVARFTPGDAGTRQAPIVGFPQPRLAGRCRPGWSRRIAAALWRSPAISAIFGAPALVRSWRSLRLPPRGSAPLRPRVTPVPPLVTCRSTGGSVVVARGGAADRGRRSARLLAPVRVPDP